MKKILLPVLLIILFACDKNRVSNQYKDVPPRGWAQENAVNFQFDSPGTDDKYNVSIGLRHITSIEYGDIMVNLKITSPSGSITEDPYVLNIRNRETGEVLGEAMLDITDVEVVIEEGYSFPEAGAYQVEISHAMDQDEIAGVLEVGLVIDKVDEGV